MGCLRNKINLAKNIVMQHIDLYVVGWVLLASGLLIALFSHSWAIAIAALVLYAIYAVLVDLYVLGYLPIDVTLDYSDCDLSDCASVYEGEEMREDEPWEDEEDLYIPDDDVEEEYEDENYNEDEDEFDFEEEEK